MSKDRVKVATKCRRKRKFHGNRYTEKKEEEVRVLAVESQQNESQLLPPSANASVENAGVSFSKVEQIETSTPLGDKTKKINGYRIIDCEVLATFLQTLC